MVSWSEAPLESFDPLRKTVEIHLREPFSREEMRDVRTIAKILGREAGFTSVTFKGSNPLRMRMMVRTPGRDESPVSKKRRACRYK